MELAGLEPAASWVRSKLAFDSSLACLQGFAALAREVEAEIFGQFPLISAGIGPQNEVFGPISPEAHPSGGRPPIGSAAASVESVRLDPELRQALTQRARRDHEMTSSVIRKALRKYLDVA